MSTTITDLKFTQWHDAPYEDSRFPGIYNFGAGATVSTIGQNVVSSVDNPNWRNQIARGVDASTAYSKQVRSIDSFATANASCKTVFPSLGATITGTLDFRGLSTPGIQVVHDSTIRDIALKRLKNKLNSDLKQFKALIPLGELREMRGLVNQSTRIIKDTILYLLQPGRKKDPRAFVKFAQEKWLHMNFGIMPILSDASNLAMAIDEILNSRGHRVVYRGSFTDDIFESTSDTSAGSLTGTYGCNLALSTSTHHRVSYKFTAGVDTTVISGNNYNVQEHFGLQFSDLPSALWELTAFSWVIDYAATVGEYLEDVFSSPGVLTSYISENHRCISVREHEYRPIKWPQVETQMSSSQSTRGVEKLFYFSRTPLSQLPRRILRFKTSDEVGRNAVSKLLNLASLLQSDLTVSRRSLRV